MAVSIQTKDSDMTVLYFEAVPDGTKAEIAEGVNLPIDGYLISEDRKTALPMIRTMSDYKWELNCLIDRLFNPWKYEKNEDIPKSINKCIACLKSLSPKEQREEVENELHVLVDYLLSLPEDMKPAARIALREKLGTWL